MEVKICTPLLPHTRASQTFSTQNLFFQRNLMCLCAHACICACYMQVCRSMHPCTHTQRPDQDVNQLPLPLSTSLPRGSSGYLLVWAFSSTDAEVNRDRQTCLAFLKNHWSKELNSSPHVCIASTLTHLAIFLVQSKNFLCDS